MSNLNLKEYAQMVSVFRTSHSEGFIKLECNNGFTDGKFVKFVASEGEKGFSVELEFPCEDFEPVVKELVSVVPTMFGLDISAPATTTEPILDTPAAPRRQRKATPATAPELIPVPAAVSQEQPVCTTSDTAESPVPRRRRRAATTLSPEECAALTLDPAKLGITVEPAPAMPMDGQLNLLGMMEDAAASSTIVENPAPVVVPAAPVASVAPVAPVTPAYINPVPETNDELLEKALGYIVPGTLKNAGKALGQLVEELDREAAERELSWFAYQYRGKDLGLKRAATRVLNFIKGASVTA